MTAPVAFLPVPRPKTPKNYDQRTVDQSFQSLERDLQQKFDRRGDLVLDPGAELVLTADGSAAQYGIGIDVSGYIRILNYADGSIGTFSVAWAQVDGAQQEITNLTTYVDAADATLQASINTNATTSATNGTAISTLQTEITAAREGEASLLANITDVRTAFASADAAEASARLTLQANLEAADTTLQANIDSEESARVTADAAEASARATLQANLEAADTTLQANIDAEESARVTADTAEAAARTALQASLESADTTLQANIDTNTTAIANETSARAAADTTLTASVGTNTSSINNLAEAYATDSSGTARLVWTVAVGTNVATLEQTAATGYSDGTWNGSAISLTASEIILDGAVLTTGTVARTALSSAERDALGAEGVAANFYRQSSNPGSVPDGSWWADTGNSELNIRISSAWQKIADIGGDQFRASGTSYLTAEVSGSGSGTATTSAPSITVSGDVGTLTYLWRQKSTDALVSCSNTAIINPTFSRTMSAAPTSAVQTLWTLYITDATLGETIQWDVIVNFTNSF